MKISTLQKDVEGFKNSYKRSPTEIALGGVGSLLERIGALQRTHNLSKSEIEELRKLEDVVFAIRSELTAPKLPQF